MKPMNDQATEADHQIMPMIDHHQAAAAAQQFMQTNYQAAGDQIMPMTDHHLAAAAPPQQFMPMNNQAAATPPQQFMPMDNQAAAAPPQQSMPMNDQATAEQLMQMNEQIARAIEGKHDGAGKTPRELFSKTHNALGEKGEKWMKDTATSCSVVAALIITVVFTAAFTVPGGMDSQGRPIFLDELSFKIFAISVALALFSSTASVQMFLGILTSRYSEDDFLFPLPKKLITGLMSLFFSIASMMVAFAATFYIVISHPGRWVTFLIASLGAVPVTLFAWMQFPLLVDIFKSTYGPGIYKPIEIKGVYM